MGWYSLLLRILQFPEKNIHYSFEVDLWPARRVNRGFSLTTSGSRLGIEVARSRGAPKVCVLMH